MSIKRPALILILLALHLLTASLSFAQQFTVISLGDFGNVTVMEATGNYGAENPDGSINVNPRQEIAKEFFRTHKDEYDFLVIFTNFDFPMPERETKAFYQEVLNDTQGLGMPLFDNSSLYGSSGRLQGTVDMGNIANVTTDPLNPDFDETLNTLSHEIMHRWGAHVKFKNADGTLNAALQGDGGSHWSFLLDTAGSVMYGNQWRDNGDGTFTSTTPYKEMKIYSPLDLYLMGMIDKTTVPPMLLIENPLVDPVRLPEAGVTIGGSAGIVTIDDIIAAEGVRVPEVSKSQKFFKTAFIYITTQGTFNADEIYRIENVRNGWVNRHSILTDGRSIVEVASTPKDDVPLNPGVLPPTIILRTLPPNINDGVQWLMNNQKSDGSWSDQFQSTERDTAVTALVLKNYSISQQNYQNGVQWLSDISSGNMDFLARKVMAFAGSGRDMTDLVNEVLSRLNTDGGWGSEKNYASNPADTALALKALSGAGYTNQQTIAKAITYLKAQQDADGGWGSEDKGGMVQETSNVLSAFNAYRTAYQLEDAILRGTAWLIGKQGKQNTDGGFGNSPSTVYDTAIAVMTLQELNATAGSISGALSYILSQQSEDGSWNESAFQTSLAVNAIYKATVDPDLLIRSEDISFIPASVTAIPTNVVVSAGIWNLGRTAVPQAKVVLYEGDPSLGNKVGEQILALTSQASTTITFSATISDGNEHPFYIVVDPDNLVKEPNELNNSAAKALLPEATYDFEVSDVTVSPNSVEQYQDARISAKITNKGTMNAYNLQVRYFIEEPGAPYEMATLTVDIPAGTTITKEATWHASKAGTNMPLAVQIDPFNSFIEVSKTNNKAGATLTVNEVILTDPNLAVSYQDISVTPVPVLERGNATISATVRNEGFSWATNINVNFYRGVPGPNSLLLGARTIPSLASGESATVSLDWNDIRESGEKIISIQADPDNSIQEFREDDNVAFVTLHVQSLPELIIPDKYISFTPVNPRPNENVSIGVSVQNAGEQSATGAVVKMFEGSAELGSHTIASLPGNAVATVYFAHDKTGAAGAHNLTFVVDPDNAIVEQNENNNSAFKSFWVQSGNQWVTEPYISPNGDGVKESTQFFFRLDSPANVWIEVVNAKGETVRNFSSPDFSNTTAGSITWDALDDSGKVVNDGTYTVRVRSTESTVLGEATVVVDTNRTAFLDALSMGLLEKNDLSCTLTTEQNRDFEHQHVWLPDGSGIINGRGFGGDGFGWSDWVSPPDAGLYIMSPDGTNNQKITPDDWTTGSRFIASFTLSPDGKKIAVLTKTNAYCGLSAWVGFITELWVMDSDGKNLRLLQLVDPNSSGDCGVISQRYSLNDSPLIWSPDNKTLLYYVNWWNGSLFSYQNAASYSDVMTVNVETGVKTKIMDLTESPRYPTWSPDGNSIAVMYPNPSRSDAYNLWVVNKDGSNKRLLLPLSTWYRYQDAPLPQWINNSMLLVYSRYYWVSGGGSYGKQTIIITDAGNGSFVLNETDTSYYTISSKGDRIAYITTDSVVIYNLERRGEETRLTEVNSYLFDIKFSNDGTKLSYQYAPIQNSGAHVLKIFNLDTKTSKIIDVSDYYYFETSIWIGDSDKLVGLALLKGSSGEYVWAIYLIDSKTGEKTFLTYGLITDNMLNLLNDLSIASKLLVFRDSPAGSDQGCIVKNSYYNDFQTFWAMGLSANLKAQLVAVKSNAQVALRGTASDLNLGGYRIDYAPINAPDQWLPIIPSMDSAVVNDLLGTWVPPYEGTFSVKLTVWDKAGNTATSIQRVTWGKFSSITNINSSSDVISPNGDGVKDSLELYYTVLSPVNLQFNIYDDHGHVITTIQKNHFYPGDDSIRWNGEDTGGNIVSDGNYKIKVLDIEFPIRVDKQQPDVGIIMDSITAKQPPDPYILSAALEGHAVDTNLKSWVVECGEGENPVLWHEYKKGYGLLAKMAVNGTLPSGPPQNITIEDHTWRKIGWLGGKKLRITAEDMAGNKASAVTSFIEEKIMLYRWDDLMARPDDVIPANLTKPGLHTLEGFETVRSKIESMDVQYWDGQQWHGVSVAIDTSTGGLLFDWDTTGFRDILAVRLKAIDELGQDYYSNALSVAPLLTVQPLSCEQPLLVRNALMEDLALLKLQVKSPQDPNYPDWTDYAIIDRAKGEVIPEGEFRVLPPATKQGWLYSIRIKGTGSSGKQYQSPEASYPAICPIWVELNVGYPEAGCGLTSNKAIISSTPHKIENAHLSLKTLQYYLEKPTGNEVLRQLDLTRESWDGVTTDTAHMADGDYALKAKLTFLDLDLNRLKEITASGTLIVDRVLPGVSIAYPGNLTAICRTKTVESGVNRYGIEVEGIAADNNQVQKYELLYSANDIFWTPALTTVNGKSFPISKKGSVTGRIGTWDITNLNETALSLQLKAVDLSGNTSCATTNITIDSFIEIQNISSEKILFSPNSDGTLDNVTMTYRIDEYSEVDVRVYRLIKVADGSEILDSVPVRTIASNLQHLGGTGNAVWDGKNDSGGVVTDGRYGVAVSASDSCNNQVTKWTSVEVDNTMPTVSISYPSASGAIPPDPKLPAPPPAPIGSIVEVKGTADDLHFSSFTLEVGEGAAPATWTQLASQTVPVNNGVLGKWSNFGLTGTWTLKLTATDTVGNKREVRVTNDMAPRQDLIKTLDLSPKIISPNNDGKTDTTTIAYEITDVCDTKIDIIDSGATVKRTYVFTAVPAGAQTLIWDGKDDAGTPVADGVYTLRLSAALSSNTAVNQTEAVTVITDSSPPVINVTQPVNNDFIKTSVAVIGTVTDPNIKEYFIVYSGGTGTVSLDQGTQSRSNYTFGTMKDLPDGNYSLSVKARDLVENAVESNIGFTLDKTPPVVKLETPGDGEYYGVNKTTVAVTGSLAEKNLETYRLRYGIGENPTQWTDLLTGNSIPTNAQLYSWKVGKNDGIADGLYTLSLYAKDKAGSESEAKVKITIDNTPPETAISSPHDGDYVKQAIDVKGTASDQNVDKYTVDLSEGQCGSAFKWVAIKTSTTGVQNGVLAKWQALPSDGEYCLRLTAIDKLGNKSEAKTNVKVDTHPPAAPVLTGNPENKANARLEWTRNTELDFTGYNLYRNNQKINAAPIIDNSYSDQNLAEGFYGYSVKAVDLAGGESGASNECKVTIDLTGPDARIRGPQDGGRASGVISIKGTAYSSDDFKQYRVFIGQGAAPTNWTLIRTSPAPVSSGELVQWDASGLTEGQVYSLKLEAEDLSGNSNTHQIGVAIDNRPPQQPVLASVTRSNADVTITWNPNPETDLAGYLLFRNDQIVNATGFVVSDLKAYILGGTTYLDKALPDGTFTYYFVAVDQAGNISDQSNTLNASIDIHAPHATITTPASELKFEKTILIEAECTDLDVASVQIQYKKSSDSTWINLGDPILTQPYISSLDPAALGLVNGNYNLKAIATDKGAKTDTSPSSITVTYTDLVAPASPQDLTAHTDGKNVTLAWKANQEADLSGYNVYRFTSGYWSKINTSLLTNVSYQDSNLADGAYTYKVTALDKVSNESASSTMVAAKVYAPVIVQPFTPTKERTIQLVGSNATAYANIDITVQTASGSESRVNVVSDANGNFIFSVGLLDDENRIMAKATDGNGNMSRASNTVIVVYDQAPAAPTGLAAAVTDYNVHLTWNRNGETDISGYNLYRDGVKINLPITLATGTASASSSYSPYLANRAFDGNSSTYWRSYYSYNMEIPIWWQLTLASSELISRVEVHWQSQDYAGKDFEIQAWSGYSWTTLAKITGNAIKDTVIDIKPSYRTDAIRIYITGANYPYSDNKFIVISEVQILKDNLISDEVRDDLNLRDGKYGYSVTAVDYHGFESEQTEETVAEVGDVVPPSPPQNLTAVASGAVVALNWSPNSETDFEGYNIYRKAGQNWIKMNAQLATGTNYTDPNLTNGTYSYRVTALDRVGNESAPSEAEAIVNVIPPDAPSDLNAIPVGKGNALTLSWRYGNGSAQKFSIYRSLTAGGPYSKINSSYITDIAYVDPDLTNGTTYYYVCTATDVFANESVYSNETAGVPQDTAAPSKPVILSPAKFGNSVTLYSRVTDITGFTKGNSDVELFRDGSSAGAAATERKDVVQTVAIGSVSEPALSPDGKTLAYSNGGIWAKDIGTGQARQIISNGFTPVWSSDAGKIAYWFFDNIRFSRISIFDVVTGHASYITNDMFVDESGPSLSADGGKIAYVSSKGGSNNIWLKDIVNNSAVQVSTGIQVNNNPRLSADGMKIAYFGFSYSDYRWKLYFYDSSSGTTTLVDSSPITQYIDWSPDGKKITFISNRTGNYEVFVYDTTNQNLLQFTSTSDYEYDPHWSPDGKSITYTKNGNSLWVASYPQGQSRQVQTGSFNYLAWLKSGEIAYLYGSNLYLVEVDAEYFQFRNVSLNPGENAFYVVAVDQAGNRSEQSDPISAVYDTSTNPDLTATAEDVYLYPPYPVAGEQMAVNIVVSNKGQSAAADVAVDAYIWNANGQLELLHSETIPSPAPGSAGIVSAAWDSTGKTGTNRLVVVIDAADTIAEIDETNNMAIRDFLVTANEGVALTTTLDNTQYAGGQNVGITLRAWNNGAGENVIIEAGIEDESGYPLAVFDSKNLTLAYGTNQTYDITWNTGTTYAGTYSVHAILKNSSGTMLSENSTPFTIISDAVVELGVVTDKPSYGSGETVLTSFTVQNTGANYIIPALQATTAIVDGAGTILSTGLQTISNLMPASSINLSSSWSTGLMAPGNYYATVTVSSDSVPTTTKSVSFTIKPSPVLTGSITVSPSVVLVGNTAQVSYTLTNSGNADALGYMARVSIIDPETQNITQTLDQIVDITQNSSKSGQIAVSTNGYALKTYTALLQLLSQDSTKNVATASFTVEDLTPPVVTIVSPQTGGTYNSVVTLSVLVVDNSSGVDKVEYHIDDGSWYLLPSTDTTQGRYATTWNAALTDNGSRIVSFRATDRAGNTSTPVPVTCVIQTDTTPPVLTISTLPDGAYTNNATLNIAGTATDNREVQRVTINGTDVPVNADGAFSQAFTLIAGANTFTTVAADRAGYMTTDVRTITLDQTLPVITILAPADNSVTNMVDAAVTGSVDKTSTVTININSGGPVYADITGNGFSLPVTLLYGQNTIEIAATDLAANSSTAKRTVLYDNVSPSVAITEPAEDMTTNQPSILLQGSVADLTGTTVTLMLDGNVYSPTVTSGIFKQTISFVEEKQYSIYVTATDAAGNKTAIKRNIIYKKSAANFTYTGATLIAYGRGVVLSAVLQRGAAGPSDLSGKEVTFTIGTGSGSQSCTGTTDAGGAVRCTISLVTVPVGSATVTTNFAGDSSYEPSTDSSGVIVFAYLDQGSFVIGDQNAAINGSVVFWDAQWSNANTISGGPAPTSFKGFADTTSAMPPGCGGTWTTPGNSSAPPDTVPAYMAVVASSSISKSGSAIVGNIEKIVVVKTDPGYSPAPGHRGTGTVMGVLSCD